jgi:transcriptional regulator with XRE-family HTH domain
MHRTRPPVPAPPLDLGNKQLRVLIGRRIKALRQQKGFTQVRLSKRAGVQPNTLRGIERGGMYRSKNLQRVCLALGTTPGVIAHVLEGAADVWLNPLLQDLLSEDLRIAQRYHHASTEVRSFIEATLKNRERPTSEPPPPDLVAVAARIDRLDVFQKQLINLLLQQFEEQALAVAAPKPGRRRRHPAGGRLPDGTTAQSDEPHADIVA